MKSPQPLLNYHLKKIQFRLILRFRLSCPNSKEIFIRPDDIEIVETNGVKVQVETKRFRGGQSLLGVRLQDGQSLAVTCHAVKAPEIGDQIDLALKQHRFLVTDDPS